MGVQTCPSILKQLCWFVSGRGLSVIIKWVKFNEGIDLIRPYQEERKKIINELIKFLANITY